MQGLHALFTGEDATWEAWLSIDASGFSGVLQFGGNGVKLRRGYAPSQSPKPTQVLFLTLSLLLMTYMFTLNTSHLDNTSLSCFS